MIERTLPKNFVTNIFGLCLARPSLVCAPKSSEEQHFCLCIQSYMIVSFLHPSGLALAYSIGDKHTTGCHYWQDL